MAIKNINGTTEAREVVDEFFRRKQLAELGFTSGPTSALSCVKADCFQIIASELARQTRPKTKGRKG